MKFSVTLLFYSLVFFGGTFIGFSQGSTCATLDPFCAGSDALVFGNSNENNNGLENAELGPNYGCLNNQPYPAWFYLQIDNEGPLEFIISQFENRDGTGAQLDVDFIVWGPFNPGDNYCSGDLLSEENIVDCSYSYVTNEQMLIPNAKSGERYIVLITNFDKKPGYIRLRQTNSNNSAAGSTDCSILDSSLGDDKIVCDASEITLDGTSAYAIKYEWFLLNENTGAYELIPGENEPTLVVSVSGNYKVVSTGEFEEFSDEDDINVSFFSAPVINQPDDKVVCEMAAEALDLTANDTEILDGNTNVEDYVVYYYESLAALQNDSPIASASSYSISGDSKIYAQVVGEDSGCVSSEVAFNYKILRIPDVSLAEKYVICIDDNGGVVDDILLGSDLGSQYIYEWSGDGQIISEEPIIPISAAYEVANLSFRILDVNTGCEKLITTEVEKFAVPTSITIDVSGESFSKNYIVTASLPGVSSDDFEFKLDNGAWRSSGKFTNVSTGTHRITARGVNGCGEIISDDFYLIGYPKFFTPNGDGSNDSWRISGDQNIRITEILIFDRYGKLLKQLSPEGAGWNGMYDDKDLPPDDYWFKIKYHDDNTDRNLEFSANFSLIR